MLNKTFSLSPQLPPTSLLVQLAAQVLDDLDDEDIGFGLVDEKKDSAVAKKLGEHAGHRQRPCCLIVNDTGREEEKHPNTFLTASPGVFTEFCRFYKLLYVIYHHINRRTIDVSSRVFS